MPSRVLPALAASLLSLALLAGCAEEPIAAEDKILIPSTSSPLGPSDGGKVAGKQAERKKARRTVVTADRIGVRFRAPRGWQVIDRSLIDGDTPELREHAARTGYTVEQLQALLAQSEVFMTGFSSVLAVGTSTLGRSLPSREALEGESGSLAVSVEPYQEISTPLGTGRLFRGGTEIGSVEIHFLALYVAHRGNVMELSVNGLNPDELQRAMDAIVPTLRGA